MAWATSDLLTEVRRAAMLPTSSNSATADADILAQADRAMQSSLVPLLLSTQEEYLVRKLTTTVTAGTAAYAVSRRAVGSRLRNASVLVNGVRRQLATCVPRSWRGSARTHRATLSASTSTRRSWCWCPRPTRR